MSAIYVQITATRGSAPRDAGTAMKVTATGLDGTIGGGALEFQAIARARAMLSKGETRFAETLPLGPNLGQCCGGAVSLSYTDVPSPTDRMEVTVERLFREQPQPRNLWLWGAGHVGRAVVAACPKDAFRITWVDDARNRFPARIPQGVNALPAAEMPLLARRAERQADHLIFTYSHDIDLALCAALLKREVRSIGLIGSDTKWARFAKRLGAMGLDPTPITCPIGDKSLGKAPAQIANGVVRSLLATPKSKATA